jgi:hypothetical protein
MPNITITDADLGIDGATHSKILTHLERACLNVLERAAQGRDASMSADLLALNLFTSATDTEKRNVRHLVNHLIISHKLPIMSAAGPGGGYFLPLTKGEEEEVYHNRRKRAMTGLLKMSRGRKGSYVDNIEQLSFWFDEPEGAAALERLKIVPDRDPVPVWLKLVTRFLDKLDRDPQRYAIEIEQLQKQFGSIFIPRTLLDQLRKQANEQVELLKRIA